MCFFLKEFFLLFFQSNEKDLKNKTYTKRKFCLNSIFFLKDQENLLGIF